jgi:low temperature requirement protein LtrA
MPQVLRPRGARQATPVTNTELFFDLVYAFAVTQLSAAADPARAGRGGDADAHLVMVAGVIAVAVAIERAGARPLGVLTPGVAAVLLAGPAIYLAGNAWFHATVTGRLPRSRLAGIGVLALLIPAGLAAGPLALLPLATVVVLLLAVTGRARRR